jgi:hypothetical protein
MPIYLLPGARRERARKAARPKQPDQESSGMKRDDRREGRPLVLWVIWLGAGVLVWFAVYLVARAILWLSDVG